MFAFLKNFLVTRAIAKFLGPVPDAIKRHLNVAELLRVVVLALAAGAGLAGVDAALIQNTATIVAQPEDVALWTGILVVIADVLRRLGHGSGVRVNTK